MSRRENAGSPDARRLLLLNVDEIDVCQEEPTVLFGREIEMTRSAINPATIERSGVIHPATEAVKVQRELVAQALELARSIDEPRRVRLLVDARMERVCQIELLETCFGCVELAIKTLPDFARQFILALEELPDSAKISEINDQLDAINAITDAVSVNLVRRQLAQPPRLAP